MGRGERGEEGVAFVVKQSYLPNELHKNHCAIVMSNGNDTFIIQSYILQKQDANGKCRSGKTKITAYKFVIKGSNEGSGLRIK